MTLVPNLSCGRIGVHADFPTTLRYAAAHGFGAVDPDLAHLATLDEAAADATREELARLGLRWGNAVPPMTLSGDEDQFGVGLGRLAGYAPAAQRFGVTDVCAWIAPSHPDRTYRRNFDLHVARLTDLCGLLDGYGLRLGVEYVGPKPSWTAHRYPFVHTLAEALELIDAVGAPNLGLYLDTYHWFTAGEGPADLAALTGRLITGADVNDAPLGRERDEQLDGERTLPGATGVIDAATFLAALADLGFDGPLTAEPFNAELAALPPEAAVAATARAMRSLPGLSTPPGYRS